MYVIHYVGWSEEGHAEGHSSGGEWSQTEPRPCGSHLLLQAQKEVSWYVSKWMCSSSPNKTLLLHSHIGTVNLQ